MIMRKIMSVFSLLAALLFFSFSGLWATTPAGTLISNGGDTATSGTADSAGDTVLSYTGGPKVTCGISTTVISQVFGLSGLNLPADSAGENRTSLYYVYVVTNTGNGQDFIGLSTANVSGGLWNVDILNDTNQNGVRDSNESTVISGLALGIQETKYFIMRVMIPDGTASSSVSVNKALARVNFGTGTSPGDGWGNIDLVEDQVTSSCIDISSPSAITDLAAEMGEQGWEIALKWTAPGDDGTIGTAAGYIIRYSSSGAIDDEAKWALAVQVSGSYAPQAGGTYQTLSLNGFVPGTTYYFAVKTTDEAGNTSALTVNSAGAVSKDGASITLVKSNNGKNFAIPGEEITYTFTCNNIGSSPAVEVYINDKIPANCTYVAGSIKIGNNSKTDSTDSDEGEYSGGLVTLRLGTINASGSLTCEFKVQAD